MTTLKKSLSSHAGFITIAKYDEEQHIVEGYGSSEDVDLQGGVWPPDDKDGNHPKGQTYYDGDVVSAQAIRKALPAYMEFANLREQHDEKRAVGTILKAEVIQGVVKLGDRVLHNPLHLIAKVSDPITWQKVKDGTLKGFSILGDVFDLEITKMFGKVVRLIKDLTLTEISLVDRPANPAAQIILWKGLKPMAKETTVAKAADPMKAIAALQALRNDCELAGNLDAAAMYTAAIAQCCQASGIADMGATDDAEDDATDAVNDAGTDGAGETADDSTAMTGAEPEHPSEDETAKAADGLNSEQDEENKAQAQQSAEATPPPDDEKAPGSEGGFQEQDKKDGTATVKKAATKTKSPVVVDTVSKAEFSKLNTRIDEVSKALSGDVAHLAKAYEELSELVDSLKNRPVLREMPLTGPERVGTGQPIEIMKGLLSEEKDPSIREILGHKIAEMEISTAKPNFVGWLPR